MAAGLRPTQATYEVHENVQVDTSDNEDHTFCGILFPVKAKKLLPMDRVVIHSVAVRGNLGPMTVWVSKEDEEEDPANPDETDETANTFQFRLSSRHWIKIYEKVLAPSPREYAVLDFSATPITLKPGQVRAIYIHSSAPGDDAIVYDNAPTFWRHGSRGAYPNAAAASQPPRYEDACLSIGTGKAHLSPRPFSSVPIWGWGHAWRDRREFVGKLEYGVVYKLWNPEQHSLFGKNFHEATLSLLSCQRRVESPVAMLPDDCVYYILNMCRWDWFQDGTSTMKARRKRLKQKEALEKEERLKEKREREQEEARQLAARQLEEALEWQQQQEQWQRHNQQENVTTTSSSSSGCALSHSNNNVGEDDAFHDCSAGTEAHFANKATVTTGHDDSNNNLSLAAAGNGDGPGGQGVTTTINDRSSSLSAAAAEPHEVRMLAQAGLGHAISVILARAHASAVGQNDPNVNMDDDDDDDDGGDDDDDEEIEEDDDDQSSDVDMETDWDAARRGYRGRVDVFFYQDLSDNEDDDDYHRNSDDGSIADDYGDEHRRQFTLRHGWLRAFLDHRS